MPWTFYSATGQRLSTAATSINVLDIDGATDIGAAIVDADLFIIDDGAGGTNRKTAASRVKTYVGAALTWQGGDTTEVTTTSTSAGDRISITSLSIAAGVPLDLKINVRKTSGAAARSNNNLKINSTIGAANVILRSDDAAADITAHWLVGPRVTNYQSIFGILATVSAEGGDSAYFQSATDMPIATVTSLIVSGQSGNASITTGWDEFHAYSYAVA